MGRKRHDTSTVNLYHPENVTLKDYKRPREEWGKEYGPGERPIIYRPKRGQLNHKEELFAHWYVKTGCLSEAYKKAGLVREDIPPETLKKRLKSAPRRIFNKKSVQLRIQELLEKEKARLALTPENIADKFMAIYERAMLVDDLGAANNALENVGKHLGMFIDKKMILNKTTVSITPTDEKELDEKLKQLMRVAGAGQLPPPKQELKLIEAGEVMDAVAVGPIGDDSR